RDSATRVIKLRLKLLSPAMNGGVISTERTAPVTFAWEPAPGNVAVYFEIAKDGKFAKGAVVRRAATNSITENLSEGGYYWRIRAVETAAKTPEFSDVWKLSVIKDDPVILVSPRNGETFTYS